jgi:hypothetical protein
MPDSGQQPDLPPLIDFAEDWWYNACLNWSHATWMLYVVGYRQAAEKLVGVAGECTIDTIIFPIAFLYRHYIELQLKRIIVLAHHLEGTTSDILGSHKIDELWTEARTAVAQTSMEIPDDKFPRITEVIGEFAVVDSSGEGFRYPEDVWGKATLQNISHANIKNLGDRMKEVTDVLELLAEMLYVCIDVNAEMDEKRRRTSGYW